MNQTTNPPVYNAVKSKLARDEVVLSMTVRLIRTAEIAVIAKTAGFDTLYIDLEHNSFSLDTAGQICLTALTCGITPFVRVASHLDIPRALDSGALGVIAPHVESAADALQVVRAAKFAPLGERSIAGNLPHFQFRSLPNREATAALNDATTVVVMIESKAGLDVVDEIASVEGVDILMIGTNDLCASLGIPGEHEHPSIRAAYSRCADACRKNGKHLGIGGLAGHPKLTAELVQLGARYISTGTDLSFLLSAATAKAKQMREVGSAVSQN